MKRLLIYMVFSVSFLTSKITRAQNSITIALRTGNGTSVAVNSDEPLILAVSISNKQAQYDERWNMAGNRRLAELETLLQQKKIKKADYDAEKVQIGSAQKKINTIIVGSADAPWANSIRWQATNVQTGLETILPVELLPNPSTGNIAVLDERGFYSAYFGIAPGGLKNIAAGIYNLSVMLDDASSNIIKVEIKAPNSNNDENTLLTFAKFYWHYNDIKKGLDYTNKVLELNTKSIEALSLKGDLLVLNKDYRAALENYTAAIKVFYAQNPTMTEPPEYLLAMVGWVKAQL